MASKKRFSSWTGGLIALLFCAFPSSGNELSEFRFQNCGTTRCVTIESPRAWQTAWNPSFAFAFARLTIYDRASHKALRVIESRDVYYDAVIEKVLLRTPVKGVHGESYYDLRSESLVTLPSSY
jgi:hypothetical protein